MCCCSCCERCCYCIQDCLDECCYKCTSCCPDWCPDIPDTDEISLDIFCIYFFYKNLYIQKIEDLIVENRNDYTIILTTILSRCHGSCVSNIYIKIIQIILFLCELTGFILICILLNKCINKPNYNLFSDDIIWNKSDNCPFARNVLNKTFKYSKYLVPFSATLLN